MASKAIIAAAGAGKTTRIVELAAGSPHERSAIVTYTIEGVEEVRAKAYARDNAIPPHIEIMGWMTFVLRELARPYQNALYGRRIAGIEFVKGQSKTFAAKTDIRRFYFAKSEEEVYSDKLSQFVCAVDEQTGGRVMQRLKERFDHIYIDEVQDLAGYDLDVLERMLRAGIRLTVVGDHRQGTFQTNYSARNSGYARSKIIKKLKEWEQTGLLKIAYEVNTRRCNQSIATFADRFYPDQPATTSLNRNVTGHDGVFAITSHIVPQYVQCFTPQVLRLDKRTDCLGLDAMNYGASKSKTFDRVLIFLHKKGTQWITSGDFKHVEGSAAKMYVGATRARFSLTFVADGEVGLPEVQRFSFQ